MRRVKSRMIWIVSAVLAGIGCVALPASAQDEDVMLDIRFAGVANIDPHSKDEAAYRAFMMLGERLAEIPEEAGAPDDVSEIIDLIWELAKGGTAIKATSREFADLKFGITFEPVQPTTGQDLLERMLPLPLNFGGPIMWPDTDPSISFPYGNASFYVHEPDASGRSYLELVCDHNNDSEKEESPFASTDVQRYDLPGNASPYFSLRVKLNRFLSFVVDEHLGSRVGPATDWLNQNRWIIDEAPLLDISYGTTALSGEHQMLASRMHNAKAWLTKLGMDPSHTFTREQFADIPPDATLVSAFPFELGFVLKLIDWAAEQEGEDPFGEAEEMLGFDVRGDVLENVGPRMMYYQSDSTGGGGLLSSVLIAELRDPARLAEVHAELIERFNAFAGEQARGYIRIRPWKASGHDVFSLATPGLPVPIEASWAIVDNRLVVAASPVGIVSAIAQMTGDGPSINDNPKFASAILDYLPENGAASATFSDTERFAKLGYGGTNLLLSGLANAVRSPSDPAREAGVIMPEFGAFASGIKPMGAIEYWDGDDYVAVMRMDGSTVVEIAEMLGQLGGGHGLVGIGALQTGILLPALGKARESANQLKSATQVRGLGQAILIWGVNNNDTAPKSYKVLIDEGFIDEGMLASPFGPSFDGKGDIVMRTALSDEQVFSYNAGIIVAIDRAMYVNGHEIVNVGFADNHVEAVPVWQFEELLDAEANRGAREDFMLGD